MPIIRRKLDANTVYPDNIRYDPDTDVVQSLVNGSWVDNPDADPRLQTTIPARLTSDTRCDAARSVADALKAQIDQTIEAVNNAKTAFTIAGLILGLFTFGVFDIFIAIALGIANAMIDAGGTALAAALSPSTYDTLTDILFCHFTDAGRLEDGGLEAAQSDVSDMIGGLGATILNAMLSLAGEGGVNNLAALGTSTGDCSDADCGCGDETVATTLDVYFGTVISRTDCQVVVESSAESSHQAVGVTWDGTHPWVLTHESLVGTPHHSHWQWYTWDGTEHGPFTGFSAPLNTEVTTISMSSDNGEPTFTVTWDVATP
jgi:hypothetical protein